jgi:hypothetical protein
MTMSRSAYEPADTFAYPWKPLADNLMEGYFVDCGSTCTTATRKYLGTSLYDEQRIGMCQIYISTLQFNFGHCYGNPTYGNISPDSKVLMQSISPATV